ncbi:TagH ABC-type polysaccharide/polyol phosphate transport system, ATPase component [Candidatus Methylopumilus universalis]|uniref:ABC transporter ATP-binding protein n=1 Tax=Candidatus Methylopumilus universalis TaxID=2588536 RepID=UPI003BEEF906
MSSDIAIKVESLSKCYQIYDQPRDRLKQFLLPKFMAFFGKKHHHYFREFWALKNVSLEVRKGETVGIIGRNGSGKSTLLQMICGTVNPTHGGVQTKGRVAALLELGSGFNQEFTGRENVYMNAAILGLSKDEVDARFDDIAAFADIGQFIEQPVKTYSSGMKVRLAFAVAINVEPEILIVDEALSVGDFMFQQKCYKRIKELQALGTSILLVSHDLSSIVEFCSSAYVLKDGRLLFEGGAKDAAGFYKQLCTSSDNQTIEGNQQIQIEDLVDVGFNAILKNTYEVLSQTKDYGDYFAEIYDWAVLNNKGSVVNAFYSDQICEIVIRIRFVYDCVDPIVGYFFTDVQGRDVVGTNSEYLGIPLGKRKAGEKIEIRFKQVLGLSNGEYSINLGCSEYINGELVAHHRLYDLYVFSIHRSLKNVGFYLPSTELDIRSIV